MGIQDRDYYREHWRKQGLEGLGRGQSRQSPGSLHPFQRLRPPRSSNRLLIAVAAAVATLIGLAILHLPRKGSEHFGKHAPHSAPTSRPSQDGSAPVGATKVVTPESTANRRQFDAGAGPRVQQVTKCVSSGGATSYSDGGCPAGARSGALLVRPDDNLADGMSFQEREASARSNSAAARYVFEQERRIASNVNRSEPECAYLQAQIAAIDAATRQPLSGFEQDNFRERRKKARERQFALRCS